MPRFAVPNCRSHYLSARLARCVSRLTTHADTSVRFATALVSSVLLCLPRTLAAQDTRTVQEPVVPRACATLRATVVPVGDTTVQPADEVTRDAPRIQAAIDACAAGSAVHLAPSGTQRAFVSGPLLLREGVTLVIDSGAILFATRDPRQYDVTPGACGILSAGARGCRPLISADRAHHSGIMGPGVIDGRGWAAIGSTNTSWWELAEQARNTTLSQQSPRLVQTMRTNDFTLYKLTLRNGPNFHVVYDRGDGFTAWGVTINTPKGARNTDGIDPVSATNVSIVHSFINTGDDNIAIKAGNSGPTRNITVAHNHFYSGHGVSVGSETNGGASAIRVTDVTFDGTDNALRIKSNGSRGGLVQDVQYDNVCIRAVKAPIYMDSHYSASLERDGTLIPEFRNILARHVRLLSGGTITLDGYDATRRLDISFDGVIADSASKVKVKGSNATLHLIGAGSNVTIPNTVTVDGTARTPSASGELGRCEARLVPFPGGAARPVVVPSAAARTEEFINPVLPADYSDPDVIRDGEDFWMTASSFGHVPGLPILHSRDLVHWTIANYAIPRFADTAFDTPQHGNGVWAPSIRKHDGWFWIFYGDPDRGIYMTRARTPRDAWSAPVLVQAGKGLIDPTPLWDDDGKAYLVHAYARSRSGIKHRLVVHRMTPDGRALLDTGTLVFQDSVHHPTAEGPKFYKKDGWYWIFAPAGGVATGWQLALRAKSPLGPYDVRTVMSQGTSAVNGPHQGAWVSLANGDDWFLHFQDKGAYGRIVHLQPMRWRADGWPVIGNASENDTTGTPVSRGTTPRIGDSAAASPLAMQAGDEFSTSTIGLQWQWQANPRAEWFAMDSARGVLRLNAQPLAAPARNLWDAPNLLLQKFLADSFDVSARLSVNKANAGESFGLIVFGLDYAWIGLRPAPDTPSTWQLVSARVRDADKGTPETVEVLQTLASADVVARVQVRAGGVCRFAYSIGGAPFVEVSTPFTAREGKWVGAKFGLFASGQSTTRPPKSASALQVNYVRLTTPVRR